MNAMNSIVDEIKQKGYCTGCGLCVAISPKNSLKMQMNASGYLRPIVLSPLTANAEKQIKDNCPGINIQHSNNVTNYHPIWGPVVNSRTGFSKNSEVRQMGSSGGVISALAIYLLETKQVDFVAQIAVSPSDPLKNALQISTTREDVIRAAGSRYAPSAPLENITELLGTGKKFAFIGKPCDVAGLRQYLRNNPNLASNARFLISFMCAGIPSIKATEMVLDKMGADKSNLLSFRYRGDGWPGMARAVHHDGKTFEMDYNSSWGEILGRHLQFRCKLCPDGTGEFADIVCADAWYGKDGYPDFTEREGRSLILTRTVAGEALVQSAFKDDAIEMNDLSISEIEKMQPYQVTRKKMVLGRVTAAALRSQFLVKYKNLGLVKAALSISPIKLLKNAAGTFVRTRPEKQ